jgi:hypothetical protein
MTYSLRLYPRHVQLSILITAFISTSLQHLVYIWMRHCYSCCSLVFLVDRARLYVFMWCTASAFEVEPRQILKVFQRFGKLQLPSSEWTNTYSSWRWQLQWLPKRWKTFNIRRGTTSKAKVVHWTAPAKTWGQEVFMRVTAFITNGASDIYSRKIVYCRLEYTPPHASVILMFICCS